MLNAGTQLIAYFMTGSRPLTLARASLFSPHLSEREADKPPLLVIGGWGQGLATCVASFAEHGYAVSVVSRSGPGAAQKHLVERQDVVDARLDVFAEKHQSELTALARKASLVVMGGEPHIQGDLDQAHAAMTRFYQTMKEAGYTVGANQQRLDNGAWPKRIVRVGSPPAELPLDLVGTCGSGEDKVELAALQRLAKTHASYQNFYFQNKVRMAAAAQAAVVAGVDVTTAAPTGIVSWHGDHGEDELLPLLLKGVGGIKPMFTPSTLTNFVPGDVVAKGLVLVGLAGKTGKTYQLAGANAMTHESVAAVARAAGIATPAEKTYSREALQRQVRLLNGDAYQRAALDVADYSGRLAINTGLLWTMGVFALPKILADAMSGGAKMLQNSEAAAMQALGFENWQIALLAEMQGRRSDAVRGLSIRDPRLSRLRYPSDAEIAAELPTAFKRQSKWLQKRGLLKVP
jgi:predicted RecA/RadA family phage recombinase